MLCLIFFSKLTFSKKLFKNTFRVSVLRNSIGPGWVQPDCKGYQQITKVVTSKERVETNGFFIRYDEIV